MTEQNLQGGITDVPVCMLGDFGLCTTEEKSKLHAGTPGWLAPEIEYAKNHRDKYDRKVDVYSLGLIYL